MLGWRSQGDELGWHVRLAFEDIKSGTAQPLLGQHGGKRRVVDQAAAPR